MMTTTSKEPIAFVQLEINSFLSKIWTKGNNQYRELFWQVEPTMQYTPLTALSQGQLLDDITVFRE
jgi:hypothetical protein